MKSFTSCPETKRPYDWPSSARARAARDMNQTQTPVLFILTRLETFTQACCPQSLGGRFFIQNFGVPTEGSAPPHIWYDLDIGIFARVGSWDCLNLGFWVCGFVSMLGSDLVFFKSGISGFVGVYADVFPCIFMCVDLFRCILALIRV